jgi:hypothetical protein
MGQVFIPVCRYIFKAMYSFVPPFREAKFCGVPSRVAGETRLRNAALEESMETKTDLR